MCRVRYSNGGSIPTPATRTRSSRTTRLELILVCHEGYSSSLAAASLSELGHGRVSDLVGGFVAWRAAGLETIAAPPPPGGLPGMGGPDR